MWEMCTWLSHTHTQKWRYLSWLTQRWVCTAGPNTKLHSDHRISAGKKCCRSHCVCILKWMQASDSNKSNVFDVVDLEANCYQAWCDTVGEHGYYHWFYTWFSSLTVNPVNVAFLIIFQLLILFSFLQAAIGFSSVNSQRFETCCW